MPYILPDSKGMSGQCGPPLQWVQILFYRTQVPHPQGQPVGNATCRHFTQSPL